MSSNTGTQTPMESPIVKDLEYDGNTHLCDFKSILEPFIVQLQAMILAMRDTTEAPITADSLDKPQRGLARISQELNEVYPFGENAILIASYARGFVLGIMGSHGAGKSLTTAELKKMGFRPLSFCSPLKSMLNRGGGMPYVYSTNSDKNIPMDIFGGATSRQVMQFIGQMIQLFCYPDERFRYPWCRLMDDYICRHPMRNYAIDDAYLTHWRKLIRLHGGKIIMLHRDSATVVSNHPTQIMNGDFDVEIFNNETIEEYKRKIKEMIHGDLGLRHLTDPIIRSLNNRHPHMD